MRKTNHLFSHLWFSHHIGGKMSFFSADENKLRCIKMVGGNILSFLIFETNQNSLRKRRRSDFVEKFFFNLLYHPFWVQRWIGYSSTATLIGTVKISIRKILTFLIDFSLKTIGIFIFQNTFSTWHHTFKQRLAKIKLFLSYKRVWLKKSL